MCNQQSKAVCLTIPIRIVALSVCLSAMTGCGSGENLPDTFPVSGTITYSGKPIRGGTVTFHPQGDVGNPAYGLVAADGTYTLTTYDTDDGAVAGNHKVTIEVFPGQWAAEEEGGGEVGLPGAEATSGPGVPGKYSSPDSTPLEFKVEAGSNTADFVLDD